MALTISGTSNGKLGNLSLSNRTANVLDSGDTSFFNVDYWYLNANQSGGNITSGWVRATDTQPTDSSTGVWGSLGNAMTVSSGVFTFPSTGIWRVTWETCTRNNASSGTDTVYPLIQSTVDNSTFATMTLAIRAFLQAQQGENITTIAYFDCQDTSNYKIRFSAGSLTNGYIEGDTANARSFATFERMGDT